MSRNELKLDDSDCMLLETTIPIIRIDDTMEPGECCTESENNDSNSSKAVVVTTPEPDSRKEPIIRILFRDEAAYSEYHGELREFLKSRHKNAKVKSKKSKLEILVMEQEQEPAMVDESPKDDDMFMVDTTPAKRKHEKEVPRYEFQRSTPNAHDGPAILGVKTTEPTTRRPMSCFNCDGDHTLRDCKKPKNYLKINQNRKARMGGGPKNERYHVDLEQKYGDVKAGGQISKKLKKALGLQPKELPPFIYRMRQLGYPPGWLLDARVGHSGISLFGHDGTIVLESDDEDGEVGVAGMKDKYDVSKIIEFPGFNVDPPEDCYDDALLFQCPPMRDEDRKENLLKNLGMTETTAYKKRKMSNVQLNNSAAKDKTDENKLDDMDIENEDEDVRPPSTVECDPEAEKESLPTPPKDKDLPKPDNNTTASVDDSLIDYILECDANSSVVVSAEAATTTATVSETQSKVAPLLRSRGIYEGTPLLKSITPFTVRPSDDKWAAGVSDVINFENLPDSVGKYEQMKKVIEKVKIAVKEINKCDR